MKALMASIFTILIFFNTTAWAQQLEVEDNNNLSLGAAIVVKPEFEGSDKSEFSVLPVIEYHGDHFFISSARAGAGFIAVDNARISFGPMISYRMGRDEDDSNLLKGMGDVDGGLEAGAYAKLKLTPHFSLDADFMHGLGRAKGYQIDLGFNFRDTLTESWHYNLGTSAQYADKKYNQQYFGIDERQSLKSGYNFYSPNGGIKHVAFNGALVYDFRANMSLGVFGEYKRLTGPAADSPLVERGSANQFSSGVAITWRP